LLVRNGTKKLPHFDAGFIRSSRSVDLNHVIWLAFMWLGLIALWGGSEAWDLAATRRRMAHVAHHLHPRHRAHPFDWADGGPSGPRAALGRG
jgi:hypothetical protein